MNPLVPQGHILFFKLCPLSGILLLCNQSLPKQRLGCPEQSGTGKHLLVLQPQPVQGGEPVSVLRADACPSLALSVTHSPPLALLVFQELMEVQLPFKPLPAVVTVLPHDIPVPLLQSPDERDPEERLLVLQQRPLRLLPFLQLLLLDPAADLLLLLHQRAASLHHLRLQQSRDQGVPLAAVCAVQVAPLGPLIHLHRPIGPALFFLEKPQCPLILRAAHLEGVELHLQLAGLPGLPPPAVDGVIALQVNRLRHLLLPRQLVQADLRPGNGLEPVSTVIVVAALLVDLDRRRLGGTHGCRRNVEGGALLLPLGLHGGCQSGLERGGGGIEHPHEHLRRGLEGVGVPHLIPLVLSAGHLHCDLHLLFHLIFLILRSPLRAVSNVQACPWLCVGYVGCLLLSEARCTRLPSRGGRLPTPLRDSLHNLLHPHCLAPRWMQVPVLTHQEEASPHRYPHAGARALVQPAPDRLQPQFQPRQWVRLGGVAGVHQLRRSGKSSKLERELELQARLDGGPHPVLLGLGVHDELLGVLRLGVEALQGVPPQIHLVTALALVQQLNLQHCVGDLVAHGELEDLVPLGLLLHPFLPGGGELRAPNPQLD
mmetsp:Transcript_114645/g.199383  ORF Transcript_114645/g.199383 Transcript_114645/m.199383 type:complete len:598 (+) Transcript_114645:1212-3005(+)